MWSGQSLVSRTMTDEEFWFCIGVGIYETILCLVFLIVGLHNCSSSDNNNDADD